MWCGAAGEGQNFKILGAQAALVPGDRGVAERIVCSLANYFCAFFFLSA